MIPSKKKESLFFFFFFFPSGENRKTKTIHSIRKKKKHLLRMWSSLVFEERIYVRRSSNASKQIESLILRVCNPETKVRYALKVYPPDMERRCFSPSFLALVDAMQTWKHPYITPCVSAALGSNLPDLHQSIVNVVLAEIHHRRKKRKRDRRETKRSDLTNVGFCLMPFTPHQDLGLFLWNNRQRTEAVFYQLLSFARDIILGLLHLHQSNHIVQDLKLENILIFQEGERLVAKLSDLEEVADLNKIGWRFARGTDGYLAPERLHHLFPLHMGLDIWSLGVILWCMFGTPAFGGDGGSRSHSYDRHLSAIIGELQKFVHPTDQKEVWNRWTPRYLPEASVTFWNPQTAAKEVATYLNPNLELVEEFRGFPESGMLQLIMQRCLQFDPRARPSIFMLADMLQCSIAKVDSGLTQSFVISVEQLSRLEPWAASLIRCEAFEADLTQFIRDAKLDSMLNLQAQQVLQRIKRRAAHIFLRFLLKTSVYLDAPTRANDMWMASLWLATHCYVDVGELPVRSSKQKSLWTRWSQRAHRDGVEMLHALEWSISQDVSACYLSDASSSSSSCSSSSSSSISTSCVSSS
jgi:serine/threonine protein kinase